MKQMIQQNPFKADLIVIGAGPAGLFTAIQASQPDSKIIILEKNADAGKKLLITGSGQCNLTQQGAIKDFLEHYGKNYRFIRQALYDFNNQDLIKFFKKRGIKFVSTEEGKVFPASYRAEDILQVLLKECQQKGIKIHYQQTVQSIDIVEKGYFKTKTPSTTYLSKYLSLATGGQSYPATGSNGDGYRLASLLGHSLVEPQAALVPLYIKDYPFAAEAGISLPSAALSLWRQNKLIDRWSGDILFTHRGLSGPGILNHSRYIQAGDIIAINLIAAENEASLDNKLLQLIESNGKLLVKNLLKELALPYRLARKIMEFAGIKAEKQAAQLSKDERKRLASLLYKFPLTIAKKGSFKQAMVTSGGISLREINPKTMESRLLSNLFAVGELLDIDGDTGGYNLQAAFSTAYLAGQTIAKRS